MSLMGGLYSKLILPTIYVQNDLTMKGDIEVY
jgi:hypothetical protein